jgi:methionyl-tRNA formyltransferase
MNPPAALYTPPKAIVFAYHQVGVRCLRALLDAGVQVPLVVGEDDGLRRGVQGRGRVHGRRSSTELMT